MQAYWKNQLLEYDQEEEFRDLKREILDGGIYWFEAEREDPVIIDAGAHIGLATVYFKWLYPGSSITAFEPNPELFRLLERNVANNQLSNVTLVPAALGKHDAETKFWIDATDWRWWSVGSTNPGAWNGEQKVQKEITVKSVKLYDFVQKMDRVDLLKMDIEGAESAVIRGLKEQLEKVEQMIFEFHPVSGANLAELKAFLEKRGYEVTLGDRKNRRINSWREGQLVLVNARKSS